MKFFSGVKSFRIILLAALFFSGTSYAKDCFDDSVSQAELNICSNSHAKKANQAMELSYNKLLNKINPDIKEKLKTAKKSWLQYRKDQCEFNSSGAEGGSVYPMIVLECYVEITNDYTKLLDAQLNCEEGDLSCVAF